SSGGFEKQHGIVRRRTLKVDLGKTSECTAPKSRIYGTQIIEKSFCLHTVQGAWKCHDRIIKRDIIGLRVIGTEVSGSALVYNIPRGVIKNIDIYRAHGMMTPEQLSHMTDRV